jgi:cell division protein FtsW (lipid II flippase)
MIMMIRIVMIASKMRAFFGSLLVLSLGIMIFVQLAVNIACCGESYSSNRTAIAFNKL